MSPLLCRLCGHLWIAVAADGIVAGYPLPQIRYRVDTNGQHRACKRCGTVERAHDGPICPETGKTKEGWRVTTCDLLEGHDGPHVDGPSTAFSKTGFWWSK